MGRSGLDDFALTCSGIEINNMRFLMINPNY
jgi:hypothetical protein